MKKIQIVIVIFITIILIGCKNEKTKVDNRTQVKSISQKPINKKSKKIDLDSLVVKDSLYIGLIEDDNFGNFSRDNVKLIKYYQKNIDSLYDLNLKELKISNEHITEINKKDLEDLLISSKNNYKKEIDKKVEMYSYCLQGTQGVNNDRIAHHEALLYKRELIETIVMTIHLRKKVTRWVEERDEINIGEIDSKMYED